MSDFDRVATEARALKARIAELEREVARLEAELDVYRTAKAVVEGA